MYVFVYLCMHVVYLVYMDMHPCSYSLAKFNEGMKNTNNIPRTFDQFEHVTETSTESALKVLIIYYLIAPNFLSQIFWWFS